MKALSLFQSRGITGSKSEVKSPFLILTPHLIVRSLVYHDKSVIMQSMKESLSSLHMWLPWMEEFPDMNDYIAICDTLYKEAENREIHHFTVFHHEKFIGMCSLMDVNVKNSTAYLGFWCRILQNDVDFGEAINAVLRYCFEQTSIEEFFIPCVMGNYVNEAVAKSLNFKLQRVDILHGKQIKLFRITDISDLPTLYIRWLSEPTSILPTVE